MVNNSQQIPARFRAALERLDGNTELLYELAAITAEDLPEVVETTEQAIAKGACDEAAAGLHKLKGMLSTFDADGVALEIQEVLDAARRGNAKEVEQGYSEQKPQIDQLVREIAELADSRG